MNRKEKTEYTRAAREELKGGSFDDLAAGLADATITRARAIKLTSAALLGGALTVLWADEADARRRRRRRRKAQVTPNPVTLAPTVALTVTNPGERALTISGFKLLESDGSVIEAKDLTDPVTIAPGDTEVVTLTIDDPLVDADRLRLIDERGVPITVVDENGVKVGVGDIDVL